jgi:hypothetical protein
MSPLFTGATGQAPLQNYLTENISRRAVVSPTPNLQPALIRTTLSLIPNSVWLSKEMTLEHSSWGHRAGGAPLMQDMVPVRFVMSEINVL